jgi:hypothetical protein
MTSRALVRALVAVTVLSGCREPSFETSSTPPAAAETPPVPSLHPFTLLVYTRGKSPSEILRTAISPQCGTGSQPPRGALAWNVDAVECVLPDIATYVGGMPDGGYTLYVDHGGTKSVSGVDFRVRKGRVDW